MTIRSQFVCQCLFCLKFEVFKEKAFSITEDGSKRQQKCQRIHYILKGPVLNSTGIAK